jgi:hypothetical protein
MPFR